LQIILYDPHRLEIGPLESDLLHAPSPQDDDRQYLSEKCHAELDIV